MKMAGNEGRTRYCGEYRAAHIGESVTACGWVQRARNLGGLIFVDLRDRTGIVQCVFDESVTPEIFQIAETLRSEYVIAVAGKVRSRGELVNKTIPTGEIEIEATGVEIFSKADTPPFEIADDTNAGEELRLKYRYLDLRRPHLQEVIALRHRVAKAVRDYYDENDFFEIETPILTKSTPEGARDYLVPSRVQNGKFYALPQSPQQYKQLLMVSGFDRYFQIARCFRDEDLRANRQPEFTQVDVEMSFVDTEDVLNVNEGFIHYVFKKIRGIDLPNPIRRMTWAECMERYGSDKPDLRFGFEIRNISDIVANSGFSVFKSAIDAGGSVRLIKVDGCAKFTRKEIDSLTDYVKTYRAKGLAWHKVLAEGGSSSFAKFMTEDEMKAIIDRAEAKEGDLLLVVADAKDSVVKTALGELRRECARRLDLLKPGVFEALWVTEFPLLEYSEEDGRYYASHHPFTAPMDEDLPLFKTNPGAIRSKTYDIVINGEEVGGGSIRIHSPEIQQLMFETLGFKDEDIMERFGHLIKAFSYGAPPHGGLAFGLDRLVMTLGETESIRDVIAFPKVQTASELMMASPDFVDQKQLDELGIEIKSKK